jgi:lauroyl/myristoyl acyltransferase
MAKSLADQKRPIQRALSRLVSGRPPPAGPRVAYELVAAAPPEGGPAAALIYRRRELRPRARPIVARGDALEALLLVAAAALARVARPAAWDASCRRMARSGAKRGPGGPAHVRAGLKAAFGAASEDEAARMLERCRTNYFRQLVVYGAEGAGASPGVVRFDPADVARLRAALARGGGAILWVDDTFAAPIIAKRALAEAGLRPSHVSSGLHGGSYSAFGVAALNPARIRAENRHLAERLVFEDGEAQDVVRRVLRALRGGALVTMTNGLFAGGGFVETPFGAGAYLSLPTTPLGLAARHGVPLFALAAIEEQPFRRYRIELGPELAPPAAAETGADRNAAVAILGAAAAEGLLDRVRRWPDQYVGLLGGRFGPSRFAAARMTAS